MQAVILCGGKGVRLRPASDELPKPMMPVGGMPILEHVMRIYLHHGISEFILSLGYLGDVIEDYFSKREKELGACIEFVDTGDDALTGERIEGVRDVIQGDAFFATYADGVADIDIAKLRRFHEGHGAPATVTVVPMPTLYAVLDVADGGRVSSFREKPLVEDKWINGGFFVFDTDVFDDWQGRVLETDVLPHLVAEKKLNAYKHTGFWASMDTYKDYETLNSYVDKGTAQWQVWKE